MVPAISKQLHLPKVAVRQSFRNNDWNIIYVETFVSDETFLFFSGDPLNNHYITKWSGGASPSEEEDIRGWVKKNLPNIPEKLADCFAYHVTHDHDMESMLAEATESTPDDKSPLRNQRPGSVAERGSQESASAIHTHKRRDSGVRARRGIPGFGHRALG